MLTSDQLNSKQGQACRITEHVSVTLRKIKFFHYSDKVKEADLTHLLNHICVLDLGMRPVLKMPSQTFMCFFKIKTKMSSTQRKRGVM